MRTMMSRNHCTQLFFILDVFSRTENATHIDVQIYRYIWKLKCDGAAFVLEPEKGPSFLPF